MGIELQKVEREVINLSNTEEDHEIEEDNGIEESG